jgi:uncharacterized membrane protein YqjE
MLKNSILKFLKLDGFVEILTGYLETRVELLKLEVREDIAKALAKLSIFLLLAIAVVFFVFFLSVTLAFWFAQKMGLIGGFGIVSFLYVVFAVILFILKKPIGKSLEKKMLEIVKKK